MSIYGVFVNIFLFFCVFKVMEHPTTTTGDNVADDTAQAGPSSGLKVETSAGGPWFRCEECGKRFNSETSVRKHVSAMHRRRYTLDSYALVQCISYTNPELIC